MRLKRKQNVLIINAYFDPWRSSTPTRWFIPRAMAPYYLAGHFNADLCNVRVWDEVFHGALLDTRLFDWPDLVIFTGLTAAFDRAHQLSAYFRNANPAVVTVIGGPIARALPSICAESFDYACQGDVEEIPQVIEDLWGSDYVSESTAPRFDLAVPSMGVGYLETTKNCNFACSFCSLTGEGRKFVSHSEQSITSQLDAMKRVLGVMVLDNNFYGNDRQSFERRVELIGERWRQGQFRGWGALVTGDFFKHPENVELMARNGCKGIFSGVESFDPEVLRSFNKKQSLTSDPRALTKLCAENGMFFDYGMIVDFSQQTIADVDSQLNAVLEDPTIPLPGLLSLTIPILGTPYFDDAARAGRLMPNLLLSDMDGQKVVEWPKEPLEKVVPFVADLMQFKGRKRALARHTVKHAWHWRRHFDLDQTALAMIRPLHRFGGRINLGNLRQMSQSRKEPPLTYCAMSDGLRSAYTPLVPLPSQFEKCFEPLRITDAGGGLTEELLKAREKTTPVALAG
ncbi:B12-binding domain-containing radical SAM protein [Nisaea nitritireducens]|uniref:B12-binding domain-containing radical SAM protein n=1 Tax=Nisaea nitritireducens TaxID=568392 RepID=UPI001867048C|nr:radical SAM protein [Nisaea nitritireducens]